MPVPLSASMVGSEPPPRADLPSIAQGHPQRIVPGKQTSIPYAQRDSCRLVIHRERLTPEQGTQDVAIDVAVTKVDDNPRVRRTRHRADGPPPRPMSRGCSGFTA